MEFMVWIIMCTLVYTAAIITHILKYVIEIRKIMENEHTKTSG